MQIYGRYAGIVALATLVVAIVGILMSWLLDWGFFQHLWLGIEQAIMLAIIVDMVLMTPTFIRGTKEIKALKHNTGPELDKYRITHEHI